MVIDAAEKTGERDVLCMHKTFVAVNETLFFLESGHGWEHVTVHFFGKIII